MGEQMRVKLKLEAIAEEEANEQFVAIIKCRDHHGSMRHVTIPLADLDKRRILVETLKNRGAYFSENKEENDHAIDQLAASKDKAKRLKFAARVGWRDGHSLFILPNRVIGKARSDVPIYPPHPCEHSSGTSARGEHSDWVKTVAAHAKFSSRIVLGISAALAAPLLRMAGLHSFGILLHGRSKVGKSTALLAAASVLGYGREEDLPNFRATDAAFGEVPAAFNDCLLPWNEFGLVKGSDIQRYYRLRDVSYGFAEGRGTTYSKFAKLNLEASRFRWRSISMGTGEETLNEIARKAGEYRMEGEVVRWIDLAAVQTGVGHIFDRIPQGIAKAKQAEWMATRCARIRAGCRRNHGVAIEQFIGCVMDDHQGVRRKVKALRKEFVGLVIKDHDGPMIRHLAKCFGHIYAAGVIGIEFKTLPWKKATVRKSITKCYRAARRELNPKGDLVRDGLKILHTNIRTLPKANDACLESADGCLKGNNPTQAIIRAEAFKVWFPDERQPNLVLKFLREKNALACRATPKPGTSIVWAECQPTWPDGSRRRSIVVDVRRAAIKV